MLLPVLAENIQYAYLQGYPADEELFDLDYFKSQVVLAYSSLLKDNYQMQKLENNQVVGFSMVTLSPDLLKTASFDIKHPEKGGTVPYRYIDIPDRIFVFPFDTMMTGVQAIWVNDEACQEFVKISVDDVWKVCKENSGTKNYYYAESSRIIFPKLICDIAKVNVKYAPSFNGMDDEIDIPDAMGAAIQVAVMQYMLGAKQGNVTDKSNNQNPNKTQETESDLTNLK